MDNCATSTSKLLTILKIRHTKGYIEDNILSHPDHPSLLSITDTLEKYRIENLVVKINADKLCEVPQPCIVQIKERGNPLFQVLRTISGSEVAYFNDTGKLVQEPKEKFLEKWTSICLLVEKTAESKEPGIEKRLADKRVLTVLKVAVLSLLLIWGIISFTNSEIIADTSAMIFAALYGLLKIAGLTVGVLLLWYEVDRYNPTLQSFCSGDHGSKINCDYVLNSKYAQILNGRLSLSLLGFSYFFGTLLFLAVGKFSYTSLSLTGWLSLASLPIILLSLYYQAVVIKQWCKFCMMVQALLVLEIGLVLFSKFYQNSIALQYIPLLAALFLMPILAWTIIKPLIEKEKETNLYKRGLKKIKNNPDVFHGLLSKSRQINTPTEGLGITLTNKSNKYNIIKVCNPYCGPCAKAHPILEDLLQKGRINLQILFTAKVEDQRMADPVRHLLAIDSLGDSTKTQLALDDWYGSEKKDYNLFCKNYPLNGELELQDKKIAGMHSWCEAENITHTPTLFINGHQLPLEYGVEDLNEVLI